MLNEDRKFQLEMLKVQLRHETTIAIFLGAIALLYSLMVALLPLLYLREIGDIPKFGIYIVITVTAITLVSLVLKFIKEARKTDACIKKLESDYIKA